MESHIFLFFCGDIIISAKNQHKGERKMSTIKRPIAVFDSGMGGISVLKALVALMPQENYLFLGDSKNAPYGKKTTEEVRALTLKWVDYFLKCNVKAIVIACNTATSAAIASLRQMHPKIPIVGLEPAVKPAVLHDYHKPSRKRILVMATPLTLRENKYLQLVSHYENQAEIIPLAAPELVEFVEKGMIDSFELKAYLEDLLKPYQEQPVDGVVLGCTHFPFVKPMIRQVLGNNPCFFDGAEGAARQTKRLLMEKEELIQSNQAGTIVFENSDSNGNHVALSKRLFEIKFED